MKKVLAEKTKKRALFVKKSFQYFNLSKKINQKKRILIKPNIVSSEPYPTTTHPEVLTACLEWLTGKDKEILVADGPAFNAGPSKKVIENHPLNQVCRRFGLELIDLNQGPFTKIKTPSFTFEIASLALAVDFIISLPVFKAHSVCRFTGALKNQYGLLSPKNKARLHFTFWKDINQAIIELNQAVKVNFWIVDLIESLAGAQEIRHGGKKISPGFILAGTDPFLLDQQAEKIFNQEKLS